jgi:hypothetical protein
MRASSAWPTSTTVRTDQQLLGRRRRGGHHHSLNHAEPLQLAQRRPELCGGALVGGARRAARGEIGPNSRLRPCPGVESSRRGLIHRLVCARASTGAMGRSGGSRWPTFLEPT